MKKEVSRRSWDGGKSNVVMYRIRKGPGRNIEKPDDTYTVEMKEKGVSKTQREKGLTLNKAQTVFNRWVALIESHRRQQRKGR